MTVDSGGDPYGRHLAPRVPRSVLDVDRCHTGQPSLSAQLVARLRPGRFDRMLAVGVPAHPGSALAVHAGRIVAFAEREAIARTLREALRDSRDPAPFMLVSARLPVHRVNVAAAEAVIDELTLRLHAPLPVCARGMARLRLVLSDGTGPFYEDGRGDLEGRFGAVRAAL